MGKLEKPKVRQHIAIEALVLWAYQRQKADVVANAGGMGPMQKDSVVRIAERLALGTAIDNSGKSAGALHIDAEVLHETVMRMSPMFRIPLLDFGHTGLVPDWMPGAVARVEPARRTNGKLKYGLRNKQPYVCLLEYPSPTIREIDYARAMYCHWWDCLAVLTDHLCERFGGAPYGDGIPMEAHLVYAPQYDREPWA